VVLADSARHPRAVRTGPDRLETALRVRSRECPRALATTEGTVYPLLRRLQREGKVEASWQESVAGPPRKYYRLTPHGHDLLERMTADWAELSEAVRETLSREEKEEAKSHG
jgi:DNA-binding PadR family transcriptional regulator